MMVPKIRPLIPPHACRVEGFGGGATFTLMDPASETMIYNDRNENIVNFFRILREHYNELQSLLEYTPYARDEFYRCLPGNLSTSEEIDAWTQLYISGFVDSVEWARRYFIVINLGFTHEEDCTSFRSSKEHSVAKALKNHVDRLHSVAARLRSVVIENLDWHDLVKNYDDEDTLFIMDPPYISEKKDATTYKYTFTSKDHIDLIQTLSEVRGQVVLCGYDTSIYNTFLPPTIWKKHTFERMAQVGNSLYKERESRTECVWVKQTKFRARDVHFSIPLFHIPYQSMEQTLMRDLEES